MAYVPRFPRRGARIPEDDSLKPPIPGAMKRLPDLWRWTRSLALAAGLWLSGSPWAMAQGSKDSGSSDAGGGVYVLPYALVMFCIALGLFLVLHPSKRRERAKPEAYGKPK